MEIQPVSFINSPVTKQMTHKVFMVMFLWTHLATRTCIITLLVQSFWYLFLWNVLNYFDRHLTSWASTHLNFSFWNPYMGLCKIFSKGRIDLHLTYLRSRRIEEFFVFCMQSPCHQVITRDLPLHPNFTFFSIKIFL